MQIRWLWHSAIQNSPVIGHSPYPVAWLPSSLMNTSMCSLSAHILLTMLSSKYIWNGTL